MRNLVYIIEGAGWSTDWDGKNIVSHLPNLPAQVSPNPLGYRHRIIHLGAFPLFLKQDKRSRQLAINHIDDSNKIILTIFHLREEDGPNIELLKANLPKIDLIHTSCQKTKTILISHGLPEDKIKVIPLGVDLGVFKPVEIRNKEGLRKKMGIDKKTIVIGSFQKDGNGWGEGETPKLIKGPDIFCQVMEGLRSKFPVMALLTGPARGYVKNRLKASGIPFKHYYPENYEVVATYFHALDFYLIASRAEGGPKAILESWASGIPVVSTAVGMVPDIAVHEKNVLQSDPENVEQLVEQAVKVMTTPHLVQTLRKNGLREVQKYSWKIIAERYYQELYQPLLYV